MELWDAYDQNFKLLKVVTLVRGQPLPTGCFQMVCEIALRHQDGSYLLMQRDSVKTYAGKWEVTAAGSALKGEDAITCARRELFEETGIHPDSITEIGKVFHYQRQAIYVEFLALTKGDKNKVVLQAGETSAYRWVSKEEIRNLPSTELVTKRMMLFIDELQPGCDKK